MCSGINAIPMKSTYVELKNEIARLQAEAERVRQFELDPVIAELNALIEDYELTGPMIFGTRDSSVPGRTKKIMVPKYVDQATGNTWTGRGPRPSWLDEALRSGTLAEHLLVS